MRALDQTTRDRERERKMEGEGWDMRPVNKLKCERKIDRQTRRYNVTSDCKKSRPIHCICFVTLTKKNAFLYNNKTKAFLIALACI